MEKDFILPNAIRQALLQYLAGRPWGEADPAMRALMSLEPLEKEEECADE